MMDFRKIDFLPYGQVCHYGLGPKKGVVQEVLVGHPYGN